MSQDLFDFEVELNPFEPDREVSSDRFAGRGVEIKALGELFFSLASGGSARHMALRGERGIGKSSLMTFVEENINRYKVFSEAKLAPPQVVRISLGACSSTEEVCRVVLGVLRQSAHISKVTKLREQLTQELDTLQIGVPGFFSMSAKPPKGAAGANVLLKFPELLSELTQDRKVVIILDETERLGDMPDFPNVFKHTVEELRRLKCERISFVLTAVPLTWERLCRFESFPRMFLHIYSMIPLSYTEAQKFLGNALERGTPKKKMKKEFIDKIYEYSDGVPTFVQHIAYYAFDFDEDNELDELDLNKALYGDSGRPGALAQLEEKFFNRLYVEQVRSNTYREILRIMSRHEEDLVPLAFIKKELGRDATGVSTYMKNMVERGVVLKEEGVDGLYKLPSRTFKLFLRLKDGEAVHNNAR